MNPRTAQSQQKQSQTARTRTVPCDLCGSASTTLLFDRGRGGEPLSVVACSTCGFCFLSPRRGRAELEEHYCSGEFSVQARGSNLPSPQKVAESEIAALQRLHRFLGIGTKTSKRLQRCLEIGCGIGSFLRLMRGLGFQVIGLEPDGDYAAFGSNLYGLDIKSQLYEDFPAGSERYDLIAAFHVLEHVESPTIFLQKAHDELAPGGRLFLELPTIDQPYGGDLEKFFWSSHLSYFSRNTLAYLLRKVGFRVEQMDFSGYFLWALAEKSATPETILPEFPLDDPQKLATRLARLYRKDHLAKALKRRHLDMGMRLAGRLRAVGSRATRKIKGDPADLLPAVYRWLRSRIASTRNTRVPRNALIHVGMHTPANAGDTLLFASVRRLLQTRFPGPWALESVWREVTVDMVATWNKRARAVVVGGGGLFLPDTNPNEISGWQWPCSVARLRGLEIPLVLFAVGYNRFRSQPDFSDVFKDNVVALIETAAFVGLRNSGSIRALRAYLPPELHLKLVYQPCPTTVLTYLYPRLDRERRPAGKRLAVNIAFDRHQLRYQGHEHEILDRIAKALGSAQDLGWEIDLVCHLPSDATVIPWLISNQIDYRTIDLHGVPADTVIDYYRGADLAVGMRGHAQMVPFGVGSPIISLVSHDKLSWFLEDVDHPEWGVDIHSEDLQDALLQRIEQVGGDLALAREQVSAAKSRLWAITQGNLETLAELM